MRLLYCYVAFTDRSGNPKPLRGMSELELNFSTTDVYRYETPPGEKYGVLRCYKRTTPLPENFWGNGDSPTNIYNVNVIAGVNGAGKSTAIQYLMDLLNYVYHGYGQGLSDRERYIRHDPSDNLNLLLFDTDKGLRILDLRQGEAEDQLCLKGFLITPMFLSREEAEYLLQRMKVINLNNTLTQRDSVLHSGNDTRLRNSFIYDCTLGAALASSTEGYFSYEVYKQVAYLFESHQVEVRRNLQDQIPELRLPRALRLHPLEHRFEEMISAITDIDEPKAIEAYLRQFSLPRRLALLCAVSFLSNTIGLTEIKARRLPILLSIPKLTAKADSTLFHSALIDFIGQAEAWLRDILFCEIISGAQDNILRIWHNYLGKCLRIMDRQTSPIDCVAALQDGRVVSGMLDRTLRVWDAATGQCLMILEGHSGMVSCVSVLPDGRVVSGSNDNTLRVWDADTGQCLTILEGHSGTVSCVAVLPSGRVVSGSYDHTLRVWDAATGQCLQILEGHTDSVTCVAVLPDGRLVIVLNGKTLQIWDAASDRCLQTLEGHTNTVTCVATLPDGRVVSGANDNTLRVWDTNTGRCLSIMKGHTDWITCVAVLPDGRVVSGADDNTLRMWDPTTGQCLQTLEGQTSAVNCLAVLPRGHAPNSSDEKLISYRAEHCRRYIDYVLKDPDGLFSRFIQSDVFELPLPQEQLHQNEHLEESLVKFLDLYHKICTPYFTLDFDWGLSSGEENLLRLFSWLFHIFPRVAEDGGYRYKIRNNPKDICDDGIDCDSVLLFMDEADLTFHPEWQRRLIHILTVFLPTIYSENRGVKDMHLILTTHSPLLLGDIPKENIHFLARVENGALRQTDGLTETFGQNIHTILKDSFFLENGTIGEFAAAKINAAARRLRQLAELGEAMRNSEDARQGDPPRPGELEKLRQIVALTAPGILRAGLEELFHRAEKAWTQKEQQQTELAQRIREASWLTEKQRDQMLQALEKGVAGHD